MLFSSTLVTSRVLSSLIMNPAVLPSTLSSLIVVSTTSYQLMNTFRIFVITDCSCQPNDVYFPG